MSIGLRPSLASVPNSSPTRVAELAVHDLGKTSCVPDAGAMFGGLCSLDHAQEALRCVARRIGMNVGGWS